MICLAFSLTAWMVLLAAEPPAAAQPREANPLVPSLHQLTDEEEAAFDRIVDRFIEADVGDANLAGLPLHQHTRGYWKAYEALQKMGPDGFFALIRGFNKAARLEYSCPTQVLAAMLLKQIRGSDDPDLLAFARENIGVGIPNASRHSFVNALRVASIRRRAVLGSHSSRIQVAELHERQSLQHLSVSQLVQAVGTAKGPRRKLAMTELEKRDDPQALATLAAVAADHDDDQRPEARNLLVHHLLRQEKDRLQKAFKDSRAEVRIAAARAACRRKPPLIAPLIDLLADEDSVVRTAAHTGLVRATHKDFGPADGATPSLRDHAILRWRAWLSKQSS